jgi:hypothetical protein
MKIQTLRNLIQEEIVKVLNETIQKAPLREKEWQVSGQLKNIISFRSFRSIESYARHLKDTESLSGTYQIVNGKINVVGDVDLRKDNLSNGKIPFAFGKVSGDFDCGDIELTSLENCPEAVGGNFNINFNQLTSLAGAPKSIGGNFNCSNNELTSLTGAPETVGGGFSCADNRLTSLTGAPKLIDGNFYCADNRLTSLTGAPDSVGGSFNCSDNRLTSLTGAPKSVGGNFTCSYNSKKFTKNDVTSVCKVKGTIRV